MKARLEIEKLYSVALNPELDYWSQLQLLAQSGELANKATSSELLFRLCQIVDAQEKEIKALKEDRVAIAKKMIELEGGSATVPVEDTTMPLE